MCLTTVSYFNQQGSFSNECKDSVFFLDDGSTSVYSLADGVNSKPFSKIGAQAIQEEIASFFLQEASFLFNTHISWVKPVLIEKIKDTLLYLSNKATPTSEFASTLLLVAISKTYNKCLWFHIGDGIILKEGTSPNANLEILSYPRHGVTTQYTYTTSSMGLRRYMRCHAEDLGSIKRLILATDGAIVPYYSQRELSEEGQILFKQGLSEVYKDLLFRYPKDDYSMLEISFVS